MSNAVTIPALSGAILLAALCAEGIERRPVRALLVAGAALSFPGALLGTTATRPQFVVEVVGWAWAGFVVASMLAADTSQPRVATRGAALLGCLTAVAGAATALTYDPFWNPDCHSACVPNPMQLGLVTTNPIAGLVIAHAVGVATACWAAIALLRSTRSTTGSYATVVLSALPCVALGVEQAAGLAGAIGLGDGRADILHVLTACLLLVALTAQLSEVMRLSTRIRRARILLADPRQRGSQALIARALGDPTVIVRLVNEDPSAGDRRSDDAPRAGRRLTRITSERGEPVAVIEHVNSVPTHLLDRLIGPTARAAIQNEHLDRELRHQAVELQASARRLVDRADIERRRLERDLHDGAQQRILGLALEFRRVADLAVAQSHPELNEPLVACVDAARRLLEAVRQVAQGVHPAVLDGSGICAALRQLADSAEHPFPLVVEELGELTYEVETVAYAIARDSSEQPLSGIEVRRDAKGLLMLIDTAALPAIVEDRVRVAGGSVRHGPDAWEVTLPCG